MSMPSQSTWHSTSLPSQPHHWVVVQVTTGDADAVDLETDG